MSEIREKLANLCHEQWSGWMEYLFSKCEKNVDGTVTMPQWAVERWTRQMQTPYADLPGAEQDSDRTEADKFLGLCDAENASLRAEVERLKKAVDEITAYLEPITKTPADCAPWGVDVARVVMGILRKAATE